MFLSNVQQRKTLPASVGKQRMWPRLRTLGEVPPLSSWAPVVILGTSPAVNWGLF